MDIKAKLAADPSVVSQGLLWVIEKIEVRVIPAMGDPASVAGSATEADFTHKEPSPKK